jgi:uncharacterized protein (TIGR02596 family)
MNRCQETRAPSHGRASGTKGVSYGFTLIELIVVLAVGAIILTLSVPALNSVFSATSVTAAANQVLGTLTLARQYAMTHDRTVAVYFFKYASTANNLPAAYRGIQAWELNVSAASTPTAATLVATVPVTKFSSLGARTVLNENFSTVLNSSASYNPNGASSASSPVAPAPALSVAGVSSTTPYMAFLFRPDGSTGLPLTSAGTVATSITDSGVAGTYYWTLTVCDAIAYQNSPTTLPADFATVQVDAVGGSARMLRP